MRFLRWSIQLTRRVGALSLAVLIAATLSSCRSLVVAGSGVRSTSNLVIDGSSTVYPIVSAIADDFSKREPGMTMIVNKSGTGSGMQKFARGEIDIAAASRPIDRKEVESLKAANLPFIEIPFAYDGVSVIVSQKNGWARSVTLEELQRAWQKASNVVNWSDLRAGWPKTPINFYGPTDNHGTYDYFAEALAPKTGVLRSDIQTNQEYNAIVQAIADDPNGLGYVGLSYFADNQDKIRALSVDFGHGPVPPDPKSVATGAYTALSRPLFLYVARSAFEGNPTIARFVQFVLSNSGSADVAEAHYVPLSAEALTAVRHHVELKRIGSLFGSNEPSVTIAEVARREATR